MTKRERRRLDLTGLRAAPSQVMGAIRLVPLLRDEPVDDLRLFSMPTHADLSHVRQSGGTSYTAYVPHALIAELPDRIPQAALGTKLVRHDARPNDVFTVRVMSRLARRIDRARMRLLPQHLGLDAYMSIGLSGPDVKWPEYAHRVMSGGLAPVEEWIERGFHLRGFADALRVFEMHPQQVGVLVFVADAFASAFVTPRPQDYRRLHDTLLQQMYGELLVRYAVLYPEARALWEPIDASTVGSLDALADAVVGLRERWADFAGLMASGLLQAELDVMPVRRLGRFRLVRFLPSFDPHQDNHVGEAIEDERGRVVYLGSFRLSAAQARRGRLLSTLVAADWNLQECARMRGSSLEELMASMRKRGLGHLLKR